MFTNEGLTTVTAVITLATVVIALVVSIRSKLQVKQIHIAVNSRLDKTLKRIDQLSDTLRDAGIDVPPNRKEGEES